MKDQGDADAEFEEYAEELFRSQAASNTVNLHYTLKSRRNTASWNQMLLLGAMRVIQML